MLSTAINLVRQNAPLYGDGITCNLHWCYQQVLINFFPDAIYFQSPIWMVDMKVAETQSIKSIGAILQNKYNTLPIIKLRYEAKVFIKLQRWKWNYLPVCFFNYGPSSIQDNYCPSIIPDKSNFFPNIHDIYSVSMTQMTQSSNFVIQIYLLSLRINQLINPFPHNDAFWRPWETSLLKTLWKKEKLLVTSNFSFSHSVFYLLA